MYANVNSILMDTLDASQNIFQQSPPLDMSNNALMFFILQGYNTFCDVYNGSGNQTSIKDRENRKKISPDDLKMVQRAYQDIINELTNTNIEGLSIRLQMPTLDPATIEFIGFQNYIYDVYNGSGRGDGSIPASENVIPLTTAEKAIISQIYFAIIAEINK